MKISNLSTVIGFFLFMLTLVPLYLYGLSFSPIGLFILSGIILSIIFLILNKKINNIQINNDSEIESKKNISKKDLFKKPVLVFFSSSLILGMIILIWVLLENAIDFFALIFLFWAVPLVIILTFLTFLVYSVKYYLSTKGFEQKK
jgi:hypothetical protein